MNDERRRPDARKGPVSKRFGPSRPAAALPGLTVEPATALRRAPCIRTAWAQTRSASEPIGASLMRIDVISLFPEWVAQLRDYGVVGRGIRERQLQLQTWNPRDYSHDRNRRVDDRPFGGGPGMVMQVEPLRDTWAAISTARGAADEAPVVMLSPQGERFDQRWAHALSERDDGFVLLCGRYEGIDQRFVDRHVDLQL